MIPFHSLHVAPKQDYLHFIHFHSFPFLYFKASNQGYLIPFHSILFLYLNTFHSFPLWTPKRSLRVTWSWSIKQKEKKKAKSVTRWELSSSWVVHEEEENLSVRLSWWTSSSNTTGMFTSRCWMYWVCFAMNVQARTLLLNRSLSFFTIISIWFLTSLTFFLMAKILIFIVGILQGLAVLEYWGV